MVGPNWCCLTPACPSWSSPPCKPRRSRRSAPTLHAATTLGRRTPRCTRLAAPAIIPHRSGTVDGRGRPDCGPTSAPSKQLGRTRVNLSCCRRTWSRRRALLKSAQNADGRESDRAPSATKTRIHGDTPGQVLRVTTTRHPRLRGERPDGRGAAGEVFTPAGRRNACSPLRRLRRTICLHATGRMTSTGWSRGPTRVPVGGDRTCARIGKRPVD